MGKYLNMIRQAEKTQKQTGQDEEPVQGQRGPVEALPLVAGDRIEWERADLTVQHGVVDFLHIDDTGNQWAFVTLGKRWAVVNMKFAKVSPA